MFTALNVNCLENICETELKIYLNILQKMNCMLNLKRKLVKRSSFQDPTKMYLTIT